MWILLALLTAAPAPAAPPRFFRLEGAGAFLDGELDGLAVDSEGRLSLAPGARVLANAEAPHVWSMAVDRAGAVHLGTGNDGRILKVDGGKSSVFFDAPELQVTAMAFGPDGRLYAATSPDGKVYAIDPSGNGTPFYDPDEKYVWAAAFDAEGRLWLGTGAAGKVLRLDSSGKATVVLTTTETHIVSLAFDRNGGVVAGSAPGGIVYTISPQGKAAVLLDSSYREIKAVVVARDGTVYAAGFDESTDKEEAAKPGAIPPAPTPTPSPTPTAEVTVTETFALPVQPQPVGSQRSAQEPARAAPRKGALLRIRSSGEHDVLWSSAEDAPYALLLEEDGSLVVGTGPRGKVYRVANDGSWAMVADLPGEQVTAVRRGGGGEVLLATSNPGRVHVLGAPARDAGTYTSKVQDAQTVAAWGQIRVDATLPAGARVEVQVRTGNTETPDQTWSDWSKPAAPTSGAAAGLPDARYLQVRAQVAGKPDASPRLHSITAAYLQHNVRPEVASITVHPPGEVFQKPIAVTGEMEILGLDPSEAPESRVPAWRPPGAPTAFSRRLYQKGFQTLSWKAEDANDDTLSYDVAYRAMNETPWRPFRSGLTEPVLAFDTATIPNGRYVVRITASDAPSNPADLARTAFRDSEAIEVDNTPPSVVARLEGGSPARVRAEVHDGDSVVRKAEYAIDGGRWREVHPVDGIDDGLVESYVIAIPTDLGPGPHVIVVRATDALDNVATSSVALP